MVNGNTYYTVLNQIVKLSQIDRNEIVLNYLM